MSNAATYKDFNDLLGRIESCMGRANYHVSTTTAMLQELEQANAAGDYTALGYMTRKAEITRLCTEAQENLTELLLQRADVQAVLRHLG